jgi:hypothetical protein
VGIPVPLVGATAAVNVTLAPTLAVELELVTTVVVGVATTCVEVSATVLLDSVLPAASVEME